MGAVHRHLGAVPYWRGLGAVHMTCWMQNPPVIDGYVAVCLVLTIDVYVPILFVYEMSHILQSNNKEYFRGQWHPV